jgi:hypothetical protein
VINSDRCLSSAHAYALFRCPTLPTVERKLCCAAQQIRPANDRLGSKAAFSPEGRMSASTRSGHWQAARANLDIEPLCSARDPVGPRQELNPFVLPWVTSAHVRSFEVFAEHVRFIVSENSAEASKQIQVESLGGGGPFLSCGAELHGGQSHLSSLAPACRPVPEPAPRSTCCCSSPADQLSRAPCFVASAVVPGESLQRGHKHHL